MEHARFEGNPMALSIDIISAVVCPWCCIGMRRLEAALELYRTRKPAAAAPEVTYHPFELNPDVPREGIARADYIAKKFGARGYSAHDRLVQAGKPLGIAFSFDKIARQPNTLAAHVLIERARAGGVQPAVKEALMRLSSSTASISPTRKRSSVSPRGRDWTARKQRPLSRMKLCAAPWPRRKTKRAPWA